MKLLITKININNEDQLYTVAKKSGYAGSIDTVDLTTRFIDIGDESFRNRAGITKEDIYNLLVGIITIGCRVEQIN